MIALIDMDLVCFRCAASAENEDFEIVKYRMNELFDTILEKVEATEYKAFLTGDNNFRKIIYPEYKANRKQEKPRHLLAARHYAVKEFNAEAELELEADDLLGINQTEGLKWLESDCPLAEDETIICSLDKDLLQIPGKHYQWAIATSKYEKPDTFITQTEIEGLRHFYEQCLKGDTSDNIKGIEKYGPVKAKKALAECKSEQEMFNVVRELYSNDDEFLMNASCLWILRNDRKHFKERFNDLAKT